ncbi:tryptophan--tRNA ligase [Desulfurococcus mucosus]|uniref:Tryptophan--tRNA ligase n=1 Tax=Desulfurococcus mucosus (strain ATCC 35584 / DSM 2162 / JCM 9187 / O7/1) TaxID=765177 RepID=E8R7K9_DESM0|nr:tryptophan--tRNA ligase [Desulfurococcus mucosus]ADV64504.1 tryptophanyl-tRNA synthetase [Desulfurococcus mucosus DSM 2162]
MGVKLDPWGHYAIEDYVKLLAEFGIHPIDEVLGSLPRKHMYFERRVIFGHRDFNLWLDALKHGEKVAVLTGFMPSGRPHLGTAMVYEELRFLQSLGAHVKIVIADAEAYIVRREERSDVVKRGVDFIAHAIAWGIDPEKAEFYYQTAMDNEYYRLIQMFSRKISMAEMEAIYGELTPGKIVASLTQAADILHLQLDKYGGYRHVVVPVGADQDPHLRLTRDLADRFEQELGLKRPSSIYHKLLRGLDGNKMSKSRPEFAIHLDDDPDLAEKKLLNALTGGRATADEQRRLGGEPWKCSIYELYVYHLVGDDSELREVYDECVTGRVLCGQCKRRAVERLKRRLIEHQERYREVLSSGIVDKVLRKPSF